MQLSAHTFDPSTGYGKLACQVLSCLESLGYQVWISSGMAVPENLKHLQRKGRPDIIIYPPFTETDCDIQYTIYESTKLTEQMIKQLKKRKLVLVPCEQNKILMENSGIKNVEIVHPAVFPKYFLPAPFEAFTFTHIGADSGVPERKRSSDVIKAFTKAFPKETDVKLIIKKDTNDNRISCFDRRIELHYTRAASLEPIYAATHVGVFPCGQEGWGYCQAELMARGRPVIVPLYGGPADFCSAANAFPLPFTMKPTPKTVYGKVGECAHVAVEALVRAFRWCYENKEDTILKGVMAYRTMLGFSMFHMTAQLERAL